MADLAMLADKAWSDAESRAVLWDALWDCSWPTRDRGILVYEQTCHFDRLAQEVTEIEQLGNLACVAIDDEAALQVLQDAIQESGLDVDVHRHCVPVRGTVGGRIIAYAARGGIHRTTVRVCDEEYEIMGAPWPGDAFARGLAAVLLFRSWTRKMWPVAERCACPPCAFCGSNFYEATGCSSEACGFDGTVETSGLY